jgi:predicted DNA-binding transcriptional regulator YafY/transcriptional regulator with XRE-family HTH domain
MTDAASQRRELAAQLAGRRAAAGLSQADVARLMRTSQSAVARLESGRHNAQLSTLVRYAEAVGLPLDETLGFSADLAGEPAAPAEPPGAEPDAEVPPRRGPGDGEPAVDLHQPNGRDPDHVLTLRQRRVLQVIRESIEKRGYPPSLREIGDQVGLTSTSTVSHHLRTLQQAGYLHRDSRRARTVEVSPNTAVLRVRSGTGFGLRRSAFWVRADNGPDGKGRDLVATRFAEIGDFAEYAASFGPDVVVLDPPELRAAVVARLTEARQAGPDTSPPVRKPQAAAGRIAKAGPRAEMPDDDAVKQTAARIGAAIAQGRRLRLRHYNPKTDLVTEREVDPLGLVTDRGLPYLHGWCRVREDRRFFRLDRVLELEVLDVPASPPAKAQHVIDARAEYRPSHDDERVGIELSAAGRWVAEYYPCEEVTELGGGRLSILLRTPDTGWVRRLALRLGEDGRVVSPLALVAEIRETAATALENYGITSPGDGFSPAELLDSALSASASPRGSAKRRAEDAPEAPAPESVTRSGLDTVVSEGRTAIGGGARFAGIGRGGFGTGRFGGLAVGSDPSHRGRRDGGVFGAADPRRRRHVRRPRYRPLLTEQQGGHDGRPCERDFVLGASHVRKDIAHVF